MLDKIKIIKVNVPSPLFDDYYELIGFFGTTSYSVIYNTDLISTEDMVQFIDSIPDEAFYRVASYKDDRFIVMPTDMAERLKKLIGYNGAE